MAMQRSIRVWLALGLGTGLAVSASLTGAFPLWLDSPTRSNRWEHRPPSPLPPPPHRTSSPTPNVTRTPASTQTCTTAGTGTASPTVSGTATAVPTQTVSPTWACASTFSPTDTAVPTLTGSPSVSCSFTVVPFLSATSSSTATPSQSDTPIYSATATPTATATATPTPVVTSVVIDDFENDGQGCYAIGSADNWCDPALIQSDSASTIYAQPDGSTVWGPFSDSSPGSSSAHCAHLTGTLAGNPASAYAFFAVELNAAGYTADTSLAGYTGFKFDFKAGTAGVQYSVGLVQTNVTASGSPTALYQYQFRPVDTAWHTITCYFPPAANPNPPSGWCVSQLAQPSAIWVMPVAFSVSAGAIQFSPVVQTTAVNFDMSLDNIALVNTAEPVPPALDNAYASINYFDDNTLDESHEDPNGPFRGAEVVTAQGGASSTMSSPLNNGSNLWPATFSKNPGCPDLVDPAMAAADAGAGSSSVCGEFTGTVDPAGWAIWQFALVPGGYSYSPAPPVGLPGAYAPGGRLVFDARSNVTSTLYQVLFETQYSGPGSGPGMGGNNYNFYTYQFRATPTWTNYAVFLPTAPGVGFAPQIQLYNGSIPYYPFDGAHVEGVEFGPIRGATNIPYDLSLDNLRFD
jgi:hypothetical protein